MKSIVTGIRANSDLTLGNYIGAIKPMVEMAKKHAEEYRIFLFVPDLHSFTTPIDFAKLNANIAQNLKLFVAAGMPIDHPNVYLYRQSYITAHSELTWILDCFTGFGEASRMIEFKDKSARLGDESVSVGLFNYPILMASDILLYQAQYVPVGEDQRQHLELTRDLAERFNNRFGKDIFTLPVTVEEQNKFFGRNAGVRIKSLRNPDKKMSKSIEDPNGTILLSDTPEAAAKKIKSATTDSVGVVNYDTDKQPGLANLMVIASELSGRTLDSIVDEYKGQTSYEPFKEYVAGVVFDFISGLQVRLKDIDHKELFTKLQQMESEVRIIANQTLNAAQTAVGLRPKRVSRSDFVKPSMITFDDFNYLDIRIGEVIGASKVAESDKLINLTVDFGDQKRTILTGMQAYYKPGDFIGQQLPFVLNMQPVTMAGIISHGMLIATDDANGPILLNPRSKVPNGQPLK